MAMQNIVTPKTYMLVDTSRIIVQLVVPTEETKETIDDVQSLCKQNSHIVATKDITLSLGNNCVFRTSLFARNM